MIKKPNQTFTFQENARVQTKIISQQKTAHSIHLFIRAIYLTLSNLENKPISYPIHN